MLQMGMLLHLLHATAVFFLVVGNYGLSGSECTKVAVLVLSVLTVAMALLLAMKHDGPRGCIGDRERQPMRSIRYMPMLYDLTSIVLSTVLLCSVPFSGVDFTGELAPGWMPTLCVALCFTLLSLWCTRVVFRALLALAGLCASCLPALNGRSDDLVGDVALWVDRHTSSEVGAPVPLAV